jgi:cyclopropane-fatty-acyl-phospholipid synthase
LRHLQTGVLRLQDSETSWQFGSGSSEGLAAAIKVQDYRFYRALVLQGTLGAAEAYLEAWWSCDDLVHLFRLLSKNSAVLSGMDGGVASFFLGLCALAHSFRRNTASGSRNNVAAHYDLGEDFYALFLDETMTYSAGVFAHPETSLKEASVEKYDRICRKLMLTPRDHVLEIGSGWGGFAVHAARKYGCRVTTTTISRRQFDYAREWISRAGLEGRVTVRCDDYRSLSGAFDKIISIEMIEAVGHEFLDDYFRKCSESLRSDGMMLLQAITIADHAYDRYRRSVDFIQKYIFPGGCLPSISAIGNAVRRATDFRLIHLEDFGSHYAETLARWRVRFWKNIDQVYCLGFDERFIRMWHYYLCYCEAGFLENQIGVAQIVFTKPNCRRRSILWREDSGTESSWHPR